MDELHLLPRFGSLEVDLPSDRLDELDAALQVVVAPPWSRWSGEDFPPAAQAAVFERAETADGRGALLWLWPDGTRCYVSNIVPTNTTSLTHAEYNALLREFADLHLRRAAGALGARVRLDTEPYDIATELGEVAYEALVRFSGTANRSTGASHPEDARRWREFLLAASRRTHPPEASRVGEWLEADGWSGEAAYRLMLQYEDGIALLDFAIAN